MTVREWLARREPAPPAALLARVEAVLGDAVGDSAADATQVCLRAAERLVTDVLRGDCASRESALDLLAADALVTYAFEAAAETPDTLAATASAAMERIASLAATQREGAIA
jgi:uncharacterized membrane protein